MITNERQYRITRNTAGRFRQALAGFDANADERKNTHPRLVKAEREALESQLSSLRRELLEYEQLKKTRVSEIEVTSIYGDIVKSGVRAELSCAVVLC